MAHIHTNPGEHDHTVSAFIVRIDGDEPRLMLHLHKKLRLYIHFGGHIEIDEDPWQAITHELREESGYELNQLKILQPAQRLTVMTGDKVHPAPIYHVTHPINTFDLEHTHFHTDISYALVTAQEPQNSIGDTESSKIKSFTRDELLKIPADKTLEPIRQAGLFVFDVCLKEWERVDPAVFN